MFCLWLLSETTMMMTTTEWFAWTLRHPFGNWSIWCGIILLEIKFKCVWFCVMELACKYSNYVFGIYRERDREPCWYVCKIEKSWMLLLLAFYFSKGWDSILIQAFKINILYCPTLVLQKAMVGNGFFYK